MKHELNDSAAALEMENVMVQLGEYFTVIERAFTSHKLTLKYEQATKKAEQDTREALVRLYDHVKSLAAKDALTVQGQLFNVNKIYYNLLRLSNEVETKVENNILFSDEAADEVRVIMQRSVALLPHVIDSLRVCNELITSHIVKEADALTELAAQAAKKHVDRMCEGTCHPKAGTIFVQMLEQLKDILWHFKAMVCEHGIPDIEK